MASRDPGLGKRRQRYDSAGMVPKGPAAAAASPPIAESTVADCSRVMVVDDNQDAASSLGRLLSLMGKQVCVVNDGPAALGQIDYFRPQVVLLDLGMPGMDGIETAKRIRARS